MVPGIRRSASRLRGRICRVVLAGGLVMTAGQAVAQDSAATRAPHLRAGDLEVTVRNRAFRIPERIVSGLTIQPTLGLRYQVTDAFHLGLDAQTVDNSGPGRQGVYQASRTVPGAGSGNFLQEVALEAGVVLRENGPATRRLTLSGAVSVATRSYWAIDSSTSTTFGGNRRRAVPTLALTGSHHGVRGAAHGSGVAVFLPADDALYLRRIPGERREFGPVFGAEAGGEWRVTGDVVVWGRVFAPVAGHNTIRRGNGAPARAAAYDAGVRLDLTPALAAELFASNALGNTGALAYVADREYGALGAGLRVRPTPRHNPRIASVANTTGRRSGIALAPLAPAFLDRGAVSARVRWSEQGVLAAVEGAPVQQLQLGVFTDLLNGTRDEGELGALARLSLRATPSGVHAGVVVAASRTNNPLVNLLAGRWDELQRLGLRKGGFRFGDENLDEGRLYTLTGAIPLQWNAGESTILRVAPVVGYVQRRGIQIGGLAAGVDHELRTGWRLAGETGVSLGRGNKLNETSRSRALPWQVTVARELGGGEAPPARRPMVVEGFVTNRAGDSPFHMLRVRAGGAISAGVGLRAFWR